MVTSLQKSDCIHYLFCSSCWAHGRAEILPSNPDDFKKETLDEYGKQKFAAEIYLKDLYLKKRFPPIVIMPWQISGPGWTIMNPWANKTPIPFQKIANGEELLLPNFGMETLHHVHGSDIAQCFLKSIIHRNQSLGESFDAVSGQSITLYGYAKLTYEFFNQKPKINFLPWQEWCSYVNDPIECKDSYYYMLRSGFYSIEKEKN